MFDLKLLEALALVVEEGGFEKAADKLALTQSAVSQRIRLLEDQIGQMLITRVKPPKATPVGLRMIEYHNQVNQLEKDLNRRLFLAESTDFTSFSLAVNGDSLDSWFPEAIKLFLKNEKALVDIRVEDQDETYKLLRDGLVAACVSTREQPLPGCLVEYLGRMNYRFLASADFIEKYFAEGFNEASIAKAPVVFYNRDDKLPIMFLQKTFGNIPELHNVHYMPSINMYHHSILTGIACGIEPDISSHQTVGNKRLIELIPDVVVPVKLFWHCWNIKSELLTRLTDSVVKRARRLLPQ